MTRATTLLAIGVASLLMAPTSASAQATEFNEFVAIYGGAQPQRRTITAVDSFDLFEEVATVTSTQRIRNGGVFKAAVGVPVTDRIGIGGGISFFGRPGTAVIQARIPDPSFFDRPTTVELDSDDLRHREIGLNFSVLYHQPLTPRFDLTFSGGPSLIRVLQDIATVSVSNAGALSVAKQEESGNAFGVNAGVDAVYSLRPALGLGLFVHYLGGQIDLPSAENLTVGGAQVGAVLRVGF